MIAANVNHVQPVCTFPSRTVMLILIFNSTAYCHAHSFILYILYSVLYILFFIHFIYAYFPCVVFYNICTVHGADLSPPQEEPPAPDESPWTRPTRQGKLKCSCGHNKTSNRHSWPDMWTRSTGTCSAAGRRACHMHSRRARVSCGRRRRSPCERRARGSHGRRRRSPRERRA